MATQHRQRPQKPPAAGERITKGFVYLTLDPSPRLRKMRDEQEQKMSDPAEVVRQAWQRVGEAMTTALRATRNRVNPPPRR